MKKNFLELTELKHILRKTQQFFDEQESLEQGGVAGQHTQLIQVSVYLGIQVNIYIIHYT